MDLEIAKKNKNQEILFSYEQTLNFHGNTFTSAMGNSVKLVGRGMVQDYDDAVRKLDFLGESSMAVVDADGKIITLLKSEIEEITNKAIAWGVGQFEKKVYLLTLLQQAQTIEEVNAINW